MFPGPDSIGFIWGGVGRALMQFMHFSAIFAMLADLASGPKTHSGMRLLDKIMILQGVELPIQPPGVGYANSPKKAKMGGYVAFSPKYTCLALI